MLMDISVRGADRVAGQLSAMGERAANASPAFGEIYEIMRESEIKLFARHPWKPLSPITKRIAGDHPPLEATGALRRSLTVDPLREITPHSLRFGTPLWYAHFALGTKSEPRRDPIRITPSDRLRIREVIEKFLVGDLT